MDQSQSFGGGGAAEEVAPQGLPRGWPRLGPTKCTPWRRVASKMREASNLRIGGVRKSFLDFFGLLLLLLLLLMIYATHIDL